MSYRLLITSVLLLAQTAFAGNDEDIYSKVGTCLGCHAVPSYTNVYPTYHVPKLAGQHAEYLAAALRAYKNNQRDHSTMHAHATGLSEQDILDIASFFSKQPDAENQALTAKISAAHQDKVMVCTACHGPTGNSPLPANPRIAGQHRDYLYQSLMSYKSGARKDPIMAGIVSTLTEQDMKALSAFYAANSGLGTMDVGHWVRSR